MIKNNIINSKSYEELTIADDFMFYKVMSDEKLCKELLETILDIKIEKLVYHETQAVLKDSYDAVISSRKRKSWRNEYMKYRADREDLLDIGMELGLERGIEQGIEQGREQERLKVIEKMLLLGMPYEEISAILDISLEELQSYVDIE